ncbi:hypothetical protein D3C76_986770 [compost metagenome]
MPGFFAAAQGSQDAELITTKAGHHVLATGRRLDVAGNDLEQLIAGIVTKAVVDSFEMIDIEEHHRQHAFIAALFDQALGKHLIEAATVDQVGQGVVMSGLLQRHPRLIQLAEQDIDPAQVVLLALQLLVGEGGTDTAGADQQGDEGDGQAQLQVVVGTRQDYHRVVGDNQGHARHAGEVGGEHAAGHQQTGRVFEQKMKGAAAIAKVARQQQGQQAGDDGNCNRGGEHVRTSLSGRSRSGAQWAPGRPAC